MKAILIPIDNRPVTYVFPQLIAQIAGVETLVPPRNLMGSLEANTNVDAVGDWLLEALRSHKPDALLVCMDSIIYGGLIPSRRIEATAQEMLDRTKIVSRWKKLSPKTAIYAQSSIMRISDNYDNTEEKAYWSRYGREIFSWSEAMHRVSGTGGSGSDQSEVRPGELSQLETRIPADIRKDYLDTRQRNFQVNRKMLDLLESRDIDFVVFSQDDSGEYGLNVLEKQRLVAEAEKRRLKKALSYAGADEVLMTLLARWLVDKNNAPPLVHLSFSPEDGGRIASRYEGQTIAQSVESQLKALGVERTVLPTEADLHVIIHTSGDRQGDHIWLPDHPDLRNMNSAAAVTRTMTLLAESKLPCIICDVAYSNGSDPLLVDQLLQRKPLLNKIWGYAGWNTTGNTLGSALSMGFARWFAERGTAVQSSPRALRNALFIRLADDWAYQTQVRKELGSELSRERLRDLMTPYLTRIASALDFEPTGVELGLPWQRSFEVEIQLRNTLQPAR